MVQGEFRGHGPAPHQYGPTKIIIIVFNENAQKLHVATRAAPFGSDMHQIVCQLGWSAPDPNGGAYHAPQTPSWFRGGAPGEREGGRGGGKGGEGMGESPGMPKS